MLAERAKQCKESPTLAISAKAKAMKAKGIDVVDFGAGQPDFEPPENVKEAAIRAIREKGNAKYTPVPGLPALKDAIIKKFKKDNNIDYTPEQIIVNCGAKHSIYNILQAIINKGDEVIIPSPYWVSYPEIVKLADGKPIIAGTDDEFKIKSDLIKEKITKKTKAIVINSPSNPTGAVIDEDELKGIAELAVKNKIYIISDEIYEKIIYDKKHISIASFNEKIKELTFTVNGLSKSHAIPGWRLGYIGGPKEAVRAISNIQAQSTSNAASIVQIAAIEALNGPQNKVEEMRKEFQKRSDFIVKRLNEIEGISCVKPEGAFYAFPKIPEEDDFKFANELLEKANVAVVPGSEFGKKGYIRISYAASMEEIRKGLDRIEEYLK